MWFCFKQWGPLNKVQSRSPTHRREKQTCRGRWWGEQGEAPPLAPCYQGSVSGPPGGKWPTRGEGGPADGSGTTVQARGVRGVLPSLTAARACQAHVPRCSGLSRPPWWERGVRPPWALGIRGLSSPSEPPCWPLTRTSGRPQEVVWDQAWNSAPKSGVGHRSSRLNARIPSRWFTTSGPCWSGLGWVPTGMAAAGLALGPNGVVGRVWAPSRADMAGCGSWHRLLSQALAKTPPLRLRPSPCLSGPSHCGSPFLCVLAICLSHYTSSSRIGGLWPLLHDQLGALLTTKQSGPEAGALGFDLPSVRWNDWKNVKA